MALINAPPSSLSIEDAVQLIIDTKITSSEGIDCVHTMKVCSIECKKLLNDDLLKQSKFFEMISKSSDNVEGFANDTLEQKHKDIFPACIYSAIGNVACTLIWVGKVTTLDYFLQNSQV